MNHILQRDIYCHQLVNPPTYDRSCDIDLRLSKSEGLIDLERRHLSSSQSTYSIRLSNIEQLGFTSIEQHALEHEFRNLLLACNLVIQRTCVTDKKLEYPISDLIREHIESKNTIQKIGNTFCVNIIENIEVRDKVSIVVSIAEMIEEKQIVEVFGKLQKINRYGKPKSSTTSEMNLNNSLKHYEQAMSEFNKLFKFKNLFNALELVVNMDGEDRSGPDFDTEAKILDPTNCNDVQKWRNFYARIKHVQQNSAHIKAYEEGEKDLANKMEYSRRAVQKILLSKLNSPLPD